MKNWYLKQVIEEKYGSQIAFATKLKVNEAVISKVINGWHNLTDVQKKQWAVLLGEDVDKLFGKEK